MKKIELTDVRIDQSLSFYREGSIEAPFTPEQVAAFSRGVLPDGTV